MAVLEEFQQQCARLILAVQGSPQIDLKGYLTRGICLNPNKT